jgi:hypothetical protein
MCFPFVALVIECHELLIRTDELLVTVIIWNIELYEELFP